jgi:hypothetical protein
LTKDPKIRGLSFQNRPAGNTPTASIQAIIKIKGQPWRLAEDWSREKEKFFCRDKPEEDIEKIAIVIANRGFRPADPEIQGNDGFNLFYSALPCSDWTGSTTYRLEERFGGEEHIVTAEAGALRFHVDLADNRSFWRAIEGTVTVRASWTWPYADGTCTQTGTRSFDAKDDAFFTLLPAAGNTLEFTGRSLVVPPTPPTISTTVTCSISSGTFTYTLDVPAYGINWFNTGPNGWPVDPTAPITGTYLSGDERWTWTFTKVQ